MSGYSNSVFYVFFLLCYRLSLLQTIHLSWEPAKERIVKKTYIKPKQTYMIEIPEFMLDGSDGYLHDEEIDGEDSPSW